MAHHHRHGDTLTPLRAIDYQDPDDETRALAEAAEPKVAREIDDGFARLRHDVEIAALIAALAGSLYGEVYRFLHIVEIETVMLPALKRLATLAEASAEATTRAAGPAYAAPGGFRGLPYLQTPYAAPRLAPADPPYREAPSARLTPRIIPLAYDPRAPASVESEQAARTLLVQRLQSSATRTIQAVLQDGTSRRASPDELARDLRDTLGLADREAKAVANFRRLLEQGDRAALNRVLRDRRFDASVQRAIGGSTLAPEKIDRMVARYAERYRMHRARTIAATETLRAANRGRRDAWSQYADRTRTNRPIRKFWLTAADERVCPVCRAIPAMNPNGVGMDEPYATPDGDVDMPPIHPSCRCTERYEVSE